MHVRDQVGRHEADIVPVHRILRARIAQTGPDLHGCPFAQKTPFALSLSKGPPERSEG
jgi:hypothetical protein